MRQRLEQMRKFPENEKPLPLKQIEMFIRPASQIALAKMPPEN